MFGVPKSSSSNAKGGSHDHDRDNEDSSSATTNSIHDHHHPPPLPDLDELEGLAQEWKDRVVHQDLIRDRKYNFKTYQQCFLGTEAVTVLYELLLERQQEQIKPQVPTQRISLADELNGKTEPNVETASSTTSISSNGHMSRATAVQMGRYMASALDWFEHVTRGHELKDEPLFYRFCPDAQLPSAVRSEQTKLSLPQLEDVARQFRHEMERRKWIQDRTYRLKSYPHCFLGSEAVSVLVELLRDMNDNNTPVVVSRLYALYVGRILAQTFQWFEHVTHDHYLQDQAALFYRFVPLVNLPSDVQLPKGGSTAQWRTLEATIPVQDRTYRFRSYRQCFIGQEAVDTVLRMKWACTRQDALQLLQSINTSCHILEHVTRDHDLEDAYLFYRFLNREDRMLTMRSSDLQTIDAMMMAELMEMEHRMEEQGDDDGQEEDGSKEMLVPKMGQTTPDPQPPSSTATTPLVQEYTVEQLEEVARVLERDLPVRNRRYRFTTYQNCFLARDAVSLLVVKGYATTRPEAELLGQRLERRLDLWHHVTREHVFRDKYYFFRFTPESERCPATSGRGDDTVRDWETKDYLESVGNALQKGMTMETEGFFRTKRCKSFVRGSVVVDFLLKNKYATTRLEATELGERLMNDVQWLLPATMDMDEAEDAIMIEFVPFVDCMLTYYKFAPEPVRQHRMTLLQEQIAKQEQLQRRLLRGGDATPSTELRDDEELLLEASERFQKGVRSKDHKYRGRTYRATFVGSEAVSFMVNSGMCPCRRTAVQMGRRLQKHMKLFDHVKGEHLFKDDYLFFKYTTVDGKQMETQSSFGESVSGDSTDYRPLEKIALDFRKNVKVSDRRYRLSTYRDVFLGKDAVDFLLGTKWAGSRQEAVQLGQSLERDLGLFSHVTKGHAFEDAGLFYKFSDKCVESLTKRIEDEKKLLGTQFTQMQLAEAGKALELGLIPTDHRYRFTMYKETLVASEVVDFMVKHNLASSRMEAVALGRALAREFSLWEHVTLDHLFQDAALFFRFVPRRNRDKGAWFKSHAKNKRDLLALQKLCHGKNITTEIYWGTILRMVESGECENGFLVEKSVAVKEWEIAIVDNDDGWVKRAKQFELRISRRSNPTRLSAGTAERLAQQLMSTTNSPCRRWLCSLVKLDPRNSIHTFFNEIAQTGASHEVVENSLRTLSLAETRPLIRFLPFNLANVFTVWRPTSFDAIRKMMTGEAVGKGLNIKGKSAKRGKLSGFVPFLQISNNHDKFKVRRLSPDQTVRVFYHKHGRRPRDNAAMHLQEIAQDMIRLVKEAKKVLAKESADSKMYEDALQIMLMDMPDPSITYIDDYSPDCFGLEIQERLFWEAYCVRQDCTRKPGSIYDTGRPSQPAFQDMNFAALRGSNHKGDGPRTVIFQNADRDDDPLNPHELLMAYEEQRRVLPVVSDFDCFLVGTRRVRFNAPLPLEQLAVLTWCVDQMERILKETLQRQDNDKLAWSILWLEVLKEASQQGIYPKTPKFGFGDPKSYSIMENAVDRLCDSGAVRHGAECFNYIFPQDLDSEYLVIAQGIGGPNVPFKYVGVDELQSILSDKIDQGFTFPLNPKWILWDGWKHLYDKLLASESATVQESMKVWYPPDSGLREKIESIQHLQHSVRKKYRKVKSLRDIMTVVEV